MGTTRKRCVHPGIPCRRRLPTSCCILIRIADVIKRRNARSSVALCAGCGPCGLVAVMHAEDGMRLPVCATRSRCTTCQVHSFGPGDNQCGLLHHEQECRLTCCCGRPATACRHSRPAVAFGHFGPASCGAAPLRAAELYVRRRKPHPHAAQ